MIQFKCPNCNKTLQVSDSAQGKAVKCAGCSKLCEVPSAQAVVASTASSSTTTTITAASSATSGKILFKCLECRRTLQIAADAAGKTIRCTCGATLTAPVAATATSSPQSTNPAPASSNKDWLKELTSFNSPTTTSGVPSYYPPPASYPTSPSYPAPNSYPSPPS